MTRRSPILRAARQAAALALLAVAAASCSLWSGTFVAPATDDAPAGIPIEVVFEGVRAMSEGRLRRAIEDRMYDLSREPTSEAIVQDAVFDLEDFYRHEGYPDAKITARNEAADDADSARRLTFTVDEQQLTTVRSMSLPGCRSFQAERLEQFWLQRASGALGFGDPLFVEDDLEGFAQSLRFFLRGEGYLDATVLSPVYTWSADRSEVDVTITIDEGAGYLVGRVTLDPEIGTALGDSVLPELVGKHASALAVDGFRTAVYDGLRRRGRPAPNIRAALTKDEVTHTIDVTITGTPGRLARIAEVEITGLDKTSESVVRGLLDFEPGETYDGSKVDESLRRLYLTGLFRRVDVERTWTEGGPEDAGEGPLRIRLDMSEQDTRSIEALAGWGSYEQLRGKLRFEEANLLGTGRGLVLEGRASLKGWRTLATVTDRNFLDSGFRASVSGDAMEREAPSYFDKAYGGTIAFSREVSDRLIARVGYSYRLHSGLQSDVVDPAAAITGYTEGSPFYEMRFDSRDSIIYPRDGLQVSAQVDANDPAFGADIAFVRARFSARYFVPLSDRVNVALRTDQGWLWPGGGSDAVPLPERFYNGGENTVRSFEESKVGPLDVNGLPLGGEYVNVFSVEVRHRLFRTFEGALFADAGNVGSRIDDYGLSDLRYGLGGGLRLALPIGPVRVDAGWNPDRRPGEREWTVHISVGYPF